MNEKITALIFSKDNKKELLGTINNIYEKVDEVVVIYSCTNTMNIRNLETEITDMHLDKIRLYYVVPLAHPEPYQAYGLSKCSNDWILYIDTDERANSLLKNDIKNIIHNSRYDAFLIRKKELSKDGELYFNSYQRRLFRKRSVEYSGRILEDPKVNGHEIALGKNYFLLHHFEYFESPKKIFRNNAISAYEHRYTYEDLLKSAEPPLNHLIRAYYKLKKIDIETEPSLNDYKILGSYMNYLIGSTLYNTKRLKSNNFGFMLNNIYFQSKLYEYYHEFPEDERKLQLNISKEIKHCGSVQSYLSIDENYITLINNTFRDKEVEGIKLFTGLLRDKYYQNLRKKQYT